MIILHKYLVLGIKKLRFLNSVAIRLTYLTGKSKIPLHPKHLIALEPPWYLKYLKQPDIVLDLGCGNGQNTIKISSRVKKIVGVDYDTKALKQARESVRQQNISNIIFIQSDLEKKLPLPANSFDKVIFLDTLEHLRNDHTALLEVYRVLKQEGLLLISLPNSQTSWKKLQRKYSLNSYADPDHKKEYTRLQAIKLLKSLGFNILETSTITCDTPLAPLIDLAGGLSLSLYRKLILWKKQLVLKHPEETTGFRIVAKKHL